MRTWGQKNFEVFHGFLGRKYAQTSVILNTGCILTQETVVSAIKCTYYLTATGTRFPLCVMSEVVLRRGFINGGEPSSCLLSEKTNSTACTVDYHKTVTVTHHNADGNVTNSWHGHCVQN